MSNWRFFYAQLPTRTTRSTTPQSMWYHLYLYCTLTLDRYSKLYLTGERKNRASSMPWFLFCPTEYAARADPRDRKAGLFKGPLMVMVCYALFLLAVLMIS
jgi:hypothetical protein